MLKKALATGLVTLAIAACTSFGSDPVYSPTPTDIPRPEGRYYQGTLAEDLLNSFPRASIRDIQEEQFSLEFLINIHDRLNNAEMRYGLDLNYQEVLEECTSNKASVNELTRMRDEVIPFFINEFTSIVYTHNFIKISPIYKESYGAESDTRTSTVFIHEVYLFQYYIPRGIAHEFYHGQAVISPDNKPIYRSEDMARLMANEVNASMYQSLDRTCIGWSLASELAWGVRTLAWEIAVQNNQTEQYIEHFKPTTDELGELSVLVFNDDDPRYTVYAKLSTMVFLEMVERQTPLNMDGILTDGLWNFWLLIEAEYDSQTFVEPKPTQRSYLRLSPSYESGLTHRVQLPVEANLIEYDLGTLFGRPNTILPS